MTELKKETNKLEKENILLIEKDKISIYIQIATVIGIMSSKILDNDVPISEIKKDLWNNKKSKFSITSENIIKYCKEHMNLIVTKKDITEVANRGLIYDCRYDANENVGYINCCVGLVRKAHTQTHKVNSSQNKNEDTPLQGH